jgi:zinc transport system substrate-binding protein
MLRYIITASSAETQSTPHVTLHAKQGIPMLLRSTLLPFSLLAGLAAGLTSASAQSRVAVTIPPLHSLAASLLDGVEEPALIIDTAVSPHTYSLTPSKRRVLEDAGLILGIGPALETGLWEAIEDAPGEHLALTEALGIEAEPHHHGEDHEHAHEDEHEHEDDHAHEHGHDHESTHDGEEHHDHAGGDPHIWLDPQLAIEMAEAMAPHLVELFPDHARTIAENAEALTAQLEALDQSARQTLTDLGTGTAITYHDAFGYFSAHYGLETESIVIEPGQSPSVERMVEIRDLAESGVLACVIVEPQFTTSAAENLAADHELPLIMADPVGSTLSPGVALYADLITHLANAFAQCLAPAENE